MQRKYHFRFKEIHSDPRASAVVEGATLNSAFTALNKLGFAGRIIANSWHTGMVDAGGSISLSELVGREVPVAQKTKMVKDATQEFESTKEVDAQCNKQKGSSHE